MASPAPFVCDVVVVGGGISGLTAADAVARAARSVVVLEAAARVGGRNYSPEIRGTRLDLGGQWVGTHQTAVMELAKRLGVELHEQFSSGKHITDIRRKVSTYSGLIPSGYGVFALIDMQLLIWKVRTPLLQRAVGVLTISWPLVMVVVGRRTAWPRRWTLHALTSRPTLVLWMLCPVLPPLSSYATRRTLERYACPFPCFAMRWS